VSTVSRGERVLRCDDKSGCGREFTVPDGTFSPSDKGVFTLVREMAAANGWQCHSPRWYEPWPDGSGPHDYCPEHRTDGLARETEGETDSWDLPLTQALILEVLAARYRGGDLTWPFPSRSRRSLQALQDRGLISFGQGPQPHSLGAWLTSKGRALALLPGYRTPLLNLLDEALHLRRNGESAPGGGENWDDWDRKADSFLRVILGGSL
jgi:hypothetical protein